MENEIEEALQCSSSDPDCRISGKASKSKSSPKKIISSCNGHLQLEKENLGKIINASDIENDFPVAFVAVIGPPQSGKSFITNLVIHLAAHVNDEDGGWLESLVKDGEFVEGFQFGSATSNGILFGPDQLKRISSGIYLWPTPFLMMGANEEKVCMWVLHYQISDVTETPHLVDMDAIENVLGLMCSRMLEITSGSDELRVARIRRFFRPEKEAFLSCPANNCDSVVVIHSSGNSTNSAKVMTGGNAKKFILEHSGMDSGTSEMFESLLDEFKHLNAMRIKKVSDPLHNKHGRFNQESFKPLTKPFKTAVNCLLMEEDEIIPKTFSDGRKLITSGIVSFLDDCVKYVNLLNSGKVKITKEVPLRKETLTKQQCQAEVDGMDASGRLNENITPKAINTNDKAELKGDVTISTGFSKSTYSRGPVYIETSIDDDDDDNSLKNQQDSIVSPSLSENVGNSALNQPQGFAKRNRGENSGTEQEEGSHISPNESTSEEKGIHTESCEGYEKADSYMTNAEDSSNIANEQDVQNPVEKMEVDSTQDEAEEAVRQLTEEKVLKERRKLEEENEKRLQKEQEKKEMERRKFEADVNVMEEFLPVAIFQVKQMVPTYALHWTNSDAFHPQNLQNYRKIYDHCLKQILEANYVDTIATYLWNDFCKLVCTGCVDECTSYLEESFEPVGQLNTELGRQLQLYGYFPRKAFEKMVTERASKFMTIEARNNSYEVMTSAMENLSKIYEVTNAAVMESEKSLRETIGFRVKNFYNEEMKRYLAENGAFMKTDFLEVHHVLLGKLLEWSRKIAIPSSSNVLAEDAQEWIKQLELDLGNAFVGHKASNELKLATLQKQINKLVSARYEEYVTKMESILQKNSDGCNPRKLESDHRACSKEQENLLGIDIRNQIRKTEPPQGHCEALRHQINQYWPTVVKANEGNLAKKKMLDEEESLRLQERDGGRGARTRETKEEVAKPPNSSSNGRRFCREKRPRPEKQLGPLIFRLSYSYVAIGTTIDGNLQLIPNANGELSTPIVVGINAEGELVYDREAIARCDSNATCWWITNFLGGNNFQSCGWKVEFKLGDAKITYDITVEFLLAYLMRSLTDHAEDQLNGCFNTAVITIPYWFCSAHRIQVKDAAKVAGFSEVYLVNEESAAAYGLASDQNRGDTSGCLLVLSENFGIISATLYSFSGGSSKKLSMIAESYANSQLETQKKGYDLRHPWRSVKNLARAGYALLAGEPPTEKHDMDSKINFVRNVCTTLFESKRYQEIYSHLWPSNVMFVTDAETVNTGNSEWLQVFNYVVKDRGYGQVIEVTAAPGSGYGSMLGASLLCRMPLNEIGVFVQDVLANDVFKLSVDVTGGIKYAISKDEHLSLPTTKPKLCKVELQKMTKDVKFFQLNPFDRKSEVRVGRLQLGHSISHYQQGYPSFEISSEAIVTLNEVRCDPVRNHRQGEKIFIQDFNWTTQNLENAKREDIRIFIDNLKQNATEREEEDWKKVEAEPEPTENRELVEAKSALLKICDDIEQGIRDKKYHFRTEVSFELLKKKVEKARNLVKKSIAELTLEELQNQTDALLKAGDKYSKS